MRGSAAGKNGGDLQQSQTHQRFFHAGIRGTTTLIAIAALTLFSSIRTWTFPSYRGEAADQWLIPTATMDTQQGSTSQEHPTHPLFHLLRSAYQDRESNNTECYLHWNDLMHELNNTYPSSSRTTSPLVWTVSGGPEYRYFLDILLSKWKQIGFDVLVVALDAETAASACQLGFDAVYWDLPAMSYSRVADSKFLGAAEFARVGIDQLFAELDVFCRESPLPIIDKYMEQDTDLVISGHGDLQEKVNIGFYYVKASVRTSTFFQTLVDLLRPSLTQETHWAQNRDEPRAYFDQDFFHDCLMLPQRMVKRYAIDDTNRSHNLLEVCEDESHTLKWNMISNLYVNSHMPPTVYDSTICIHPLATQPFSSFRSKLTTARFLGFDPVDAKNDHRPMLKTLSGDLAFSEDWGYTFSADQFHETNNLQKNLQYPLATIIQMARNSSRVLVLPRHVRSKDNKAYPIFSLVSTASIEQLGVPWRFLTPAEARAKLNATAVIELPDWSLATANQLVESDCKDSQVCAVHRLYKANRESPEINDIVQNLTWCLNVPGPVETFSFSAGAGHHEHSCF